MPNIQVKPGQTMFDVSIEHLGDASKAMQLAAANNLAVTDDLTAGQILALPDVEITAKMQKIINHFLNTGEPPATHLPI